MVVDPLGRPWLQPGWFMTGLIKKSIISSRERRDGRRKRLGFVSQKKGLRKFSFRSGDAGVS